jgi:hypothetical protein
MNKKVSLSIHSVLAILLDLYTLQDHFYLQYDWNHFFSKSSLPILHMVRAFSSNASLFYGAVMAHKVMICFIGTEDPLCSRNSGTG